MEGYRERVFLSLIYGFAGIALGLFVVLNVQAKDFGTLGHTYEIREQDLIEYIKNKLQTIDLNVHMEEMEARVRSSVRRPKALLGITNAKEDKSWRYDPTYVLQKDLKDHEGKIIHKKGYTVNPLARMGLSKALIFIDGDDEEQVKYALKESSQQPVKIVLVKGSPLDLQKKHKVWIYFDQFGFLTTKLGIKHVPAIITQEGLRLKVQELSPIEFAHKEKLANSGGIKMRGKL